MKYHELSAEELKNKMAEKGHLLLDVREEYEYEDNNIGGINMPLSSVLGRIEELKRYPEITICCASGKRSAAMAVHLAKKLESHKINSLKGGIESYLTHA